MYEYQQQKHPLQTFQFWFVILICVCGVAAWQSGMLADRNVEPSVTRQVVNVPDEAMPPIPGTDKDRSPSTKSNDQIAENDQIAATVEQPETETQAVDLTIPEAPMQTEERDSSETTQHRLDDNQSTGDLESDAPKVITLSFNQVVEADSSESGIQQVAAVTTATTPEEHDFSLPESESVEETADHLSENGNVEASHIDEVHELRPAQPRLKAVPLDLESIDTMVAEGREVEALRQLSIWYWKEPASRSQFSDRLTVLSRRVYFHKQPHYIEPYEVVFGDSLETIAKQYQVPWEYLSRINQTPPDRIRAGQKLKVNQGPFDVVVDLSDYELTVHSQGYFVVRMPVGIGRDGLTPVGRFRVTEKVAEPTYQGQHRTTASSHPTSSDGKFWIAFNDEDASLNGIGFHGTIDPESIGRAESNGSIRLHNQHIQDLFHLVTVGSEVVVCH
ncbi:putative L,D-transpeptidase YkuD [Thalassoglobus neptunius]|uniref:Putative L,D-transpeptidase YkuD n=1 Tax=Thalassoglobus neptunius TaxID=1938619 RepID=A0A5C5X2N6_9PLAN|nr:L,D-transpeptidase family protein [Thalassoglobus neptunius]TWT57196.1 putative L,D-transpeptidase YkuD [Thalassoglobus neptunius]